MRIGNKILITVASTCALGAAVRIWAQATAGTTQTPAATTVLSGAATPAPGTVAAPAAAGRGGGAAFAGARRRGPDFPQQTRKLAPPEVLARGKGLYGVNCSACHGLDLRGGDMGAPNLLRSQTVLNDQHGELILPIVHGALQSGGMPAFTLPDADVAAIAEYIHGVEAQAGNQGSPPGFPDMGVLKVIVGDPVAGKAYFDKTCAGCHSVTGDLAGIGAKCPDGRTLQNVWVGGAAAGGRGRGAQAQDTVTVTLTNGQKIQGRVAEINDFIVAVILPDGSRRSFERTYNVASVDVHSGPGDAHKQLVLKLDDTDIHNVTAYLHTIQ